MSEIKIGRSGPGDDGENEAETDEERRKRYLRNREAVHYSSWLDPKSKQSVHISDHDADVVDLALGPKGSLADKALYSIAKHQKGPTVYDREWLAAKIGAQDIDAVTRHLKLLSSEGMIRYRSKRTKTRDDRRTGIWMEWINDNAAEQVSAADDANRSALRERDTRVDELQGIVDRMRVATSEELPALMAKLHAATGGNGPIEPLGEGPESPDDGPKSSPSGGHSCEVGEPHGHADGKSSPSTAPSDSDKGSPLTGYDELAKADKRADRAGAQYQRDAMMAYHELLKDELKPAPEEILRAYEVYTGELAENGKEKMMRPLARWLSVDGEWSARDGIRKLRKARKTAENDPEREWPETVLCPRCGQPAEHVSGSTYVCYAHDSSGDLDFPQAAYRFVYHPPKLE